MYSPPMSGPVHNTTTNNNMTISTLLRKTPHGEGLPGLPETVRKAILIALLDGVVAIHAEHRFHGRLRPWNVMISSTGKVSLVDNDNTASSEFAEDRWYWSPERLLGYSNDLNETADLWALGCLFAELICGHAFFLSFDVANQLYIMFKILGFPKREEVQYLGSAYDQLTFPKTDLRCNLGSRLKGLGAAGIDLISKLLHYDPAKRLSAHQALNHPYLISHDASLADLSPLTPLSPNIGYRFLPLQHNANNANSTNNKNNKNNANNASTNTNTNNNYPVAVAASPSFLSEQRDMAIRLPSPPNGLECSDGEGPGVTQYTSFSHSLERAGPKEHKGVKEDAEEEVSLSVVSQQLLGDVSHTIRRDWKSLSQDVHTEIQHFHNVVQRSKECEATCSGAQLKWPNSNLAKSIQRDYDAAISSCGELKLAIRGMRRYYKEAKALRLEMEASLGELSSVFHRHDGEEMPSNSYASNIEDIDAHKADELLDATQRRKERFTKAVDKLLHSIAKCRATIKEGEEYVSQVERWSMYVNEGTSTASPKLSPTHHHISNNNTTSNVHMVSLSLSSPLSSLHMDAEEAEAVALLNPGFLSFVRENGWGDAGPKKPTANTARTFASTTTTAFEAKRAQMQNVPRKESGKYTSRPWRL